MKKFFKENQKGFTLIELLVVIAILAVLATLYVPKIVQSTADAKKTVEIANARTLASEITTYNATKTTGQIKGSGDKPTSILTTATWKEGWKVVTKDDLASTTLLDGRSFPDSTYVLLVTDTNHNCFILNTDGSPITVVDATGSPTPAKE